MSKISIIEGEEKFSFVKNVEPNFLYNRFDILYNNDFELLRCISKNKTFFIPLHFENDICFLGVYLSFIGQNLFNDVIKYVFKNFKNINFIRVRQALYDYKGLNAIEHFTLNLPNTTDEYWRQFSSKRKYNYRRAKRQLEEKYKITYEKFHNDEITEDLIDIFLKIKNLDFKSNYRVTKETFQEKYHVTDMFLMKADEEIISMALFATTGETCYFENVTYNPKFKDFSVGMQCIFYGIENLIHQGVKTVYCGGGAYVYKEILKAEKTDTFNGVIKRENKTNMLQNIFSIKNEYRNNVKRKVIKVLGLKISFKKKIIDENPDTLNIKFAIGGGFGDFLIAANYIYHFAKYIEKEKNKNIRIDVFAKKCQFGLLKSTLTENTFVDNLFEFEEKNNIKYDVCANLSINCSFIYNDFEKIKKLNSNLWNVIEGQDKFNKNNIFDKTGHLNFYQIALANNKNRLQMADVADILKIGKNFDYPTPYPKNENEILEKFGLKDKIFITFNHGTDKDTLFESTKLWPIEKFSQLTKLLKKAFCDIVFVQIGAKKDISKDIDNIDINLVGKTTLDEVKVLIKNSLLHFDCEGGFAHLRNALRTKHPAIVIFGPTNPNLYGYETNINIKSNACPIRCEWVVQNWQQNCVRKDNSCVCINSIDVDTVFCAAKEYINAFAEQMLISPGGGKIPK